MSEHPSKSFALVPLLVIVDAIIVAKNVVFSDATFMELPASLPSKQQFDE